MSTRRLTILVIEDSRTYAELASTMLGYLGHTVKVAGSAEAGLAMADTDPPDLIFMDLNLPGMSGYEAVQMMRRNPRLQFVPTVATTVSEIVDRAAIEKGLRAGFSGFTEKPHQADGFRFIIETYVPE